MTFNLQFISEAVLATAYLILKLYLAFLIGRLVSPRWGLDRLSSFVAGWLAVQTVQTGIIIALSIFGAMTQPYFLTACAILFAIPIWKSGKNPREDFTIVSWRDLPALMATIFVLIVMWLRSLFLYDFTWDAQVYGLPRLAIWLNAGSVLVHMPTLQLNLFVNEWNAELNALAYAVASDSYMGFAFGNLEILGFLFISVAWVARLLGVSNTWAIIISTVLGSTPAMVGLASTVKGDLLAITSFLIAIGWLIQLRQYRSPIIFFLFLMSAAMAVGSKISVVLPVFSLIAFAVAALGNNGFRALLRLPKGIQLFFVIGLILISSRFWANWIVYGNPMRRIDVEQAHFSFHNMLANLELVSDRLFDVTDSIQGVGAMWALAGDMGGGAWFIVAAISLCAVGAIYRRTTARNPISFSALRRFRASRLTVRWIAIVSVAIALTTIASMTLSLAYQWTFRYFGPGIMVLLVGGGAFALEKARADWQRDTLFALAAVAFAANISIWMRVGEVMPTQNFDSLFTELEQADTPLKRMSLFIKGPYDIAAVDALDLDSVRPLDLLIFKDLEISLIPFLGSHAQNRLQLVATGNDMLVEAATRRWGVVAVLQEASKRGPNLAVALEKLGYIVLVNNPQYIIALPNERIELSAKLDNTPLQWTPWTAPGSATLQVRNGIPEIESSIPVDIGFATQTLPLKGTTLIRAYFEGEVKGPGSHAAHLSVHGVKPVIALPTGQYIGTESHQGLVVNPVADNTQRLSFGLGGWAMGSGHLRLIRLDAYQLRVTDTATSDKMISRHKSGHSRLKSALIATGILIACAFLGQYVLSFCGLSGFSLLGGSLLAGYGLFGLALVCSLRTFGTPIPGAVGAGLALLALMATMPRAFRFWQPGSKKHSLADYSAKINQNLQLFARKSNFITIAILIVLISWLVSIFLSYVPLASLADSLRYQFPDIYDLPKHLFAQSALDDASNWPPPNPFFAGQQFTYNFLFYYPSALIAQLTGNPYANFQVFPFIVLMIGISLPMAVLDIVRSITSSRPIHLACVLLSTWVGGLTPLFVAGKPGIGFFLFQEKLLTSSIWVDELYQSVIFVPQHVFAVLCGLVSMSILVKSRLGEYKPVLLAGLITVCGALSSLILLPHLLAAYGLGMLISFVLRQRIFDHGSGNNSSPFNLQTFLQFSTAFVLPFTLLLPFVVESLKWSSGTGALLVLPDLTHQWLYVMGALGVVVPLALFALRPLFLGAGVFSNPTTSCTGYGIAAFTLIGVMGILFFGYPDAGIKSGLWLRIALIPLACIGMATIIEMVQKTKLTAVALIALASIGIVISAVNFPTMKHFIHSARLPIDPSTKNFVSTVRRLPANARIAIFSSDQNLVAMAGRQIDFDFSPIREDSYMPPEGRQHAKAFWTAFNANDPDIWKVVLQRYDYLIAPHGSPAEARISARFPVVGNAGPYAIFKITSRQHN